jgi:hypothetical protein
MQAHYRRRLPRSCVHQVTDCMRRGAALPPPTTAFRRRAAVAGAPCEESRRTGHGAGKVRHAAQRRYGVAPVVVSNGMRSSGFCVAAAAGNTGSLFSKHMHRMSFPLYCASPSARVPPRPQMLGIQHDEPAHGASALDDAVNGTADKSAARHAVALSTSTAAPAATAIAATAAVVVAAVTNRWCLGAPTSSAPTPPIPAATGKPFR